MKGIDLRHKFKIALTDSHVANISVDLAKQLLMDNFKIKWSNDVMSQNKLDVYRLVKQNFCAENVVKLNSKKQIRSVITQLRAGCLPIEIELGRTKIFQEINAYASNAHKIILKTNFILLFIVQNLIKLDMTC